MRVVVAILHGIGKTTPGYATSFIRGVRRQFERSVRRLVATDIDLTQEISFREIVWDDILGENQEKLKEIFQAEFERRRKIAQAGAWTRITVVTLLTLLFFSLVDGLCWRIVFVAVVLGFIYGKKILVPLRTAFAAEFVNDIIGYRNKEAYQAISRRIEECLAGQADTTLKVPLTIVSHSLGTVIASDFVYDRQKQRGALHPNLTLWNFFTMGSPLALFSLQYGPELFKSPIRLEEMRGRWVNILDADDVIAYPLKPLNEAYEKLVHRDLYVESGLLGIAHVKYWDTAKVHEAIGRKLALDWLAVNEKLPADALARLYADYDARQ